MWHWSLGHLHHLQHHRARKVSQHLLQLPHLPISEESQTNYLVVGWSSHTQVSLRRHHHNGNIRGSGGSSHRLRSLRQNIQCLFDEFRILHQPVDVWGGIRRIVGHLLRAGKHISAPRNISCRVWQDGRPGHAHCLALLEGVLVDADVHARHRKQNLRNHHRWSGATHLLQFDGWVAGLQLASGPRIDDEQGSLLEGRSECHHQRTTTHGCAPAGCRYAQLGGGRFGTDCLPRDVPSWVVLLTIEWHQLSCGGFDAQITNRISQSGIGRWRHVHAIRG